MSSSYHLLLLVQLAAVLANNAVVSGKGGAKPASSFFTLCPKQDAKALSECIKKNLVELRPKVAKGIPDLEIVPFDPLFIPRVASDEGGSFVVKTTLSNVTLKGLGQYSINSVSARMDDDGLVMNMTLAIPETNVTGDYMIDGQILLLPIRGSGNFEINSTDLVAELQMVTKVVSRDGGRYLAVEKIKCRLDLKGVSRSWFYNLFNGDKVLGDGTNTFLNANYLEGHDATRHIPEGIVQEILQGTVSKIFSKYTVDELFLKK